MGATVFILGAGFSRSISDAMPLTDLTIGSMLGSALAGGEQRVVIADLCPEPIRERLTRIGVAPDRMQTSSAADGGPIEARVRTLAAKRSQEVARELASAAQTDQLVVHWGSTCFAPVVDLRESEDAIVCEIEPTEGILRRAARSRAVDEPRLVTVADLLASPGRPLLVRLDDGSTQYLVAACHDQEYVNSTEAWALLRAAGMPPTARAV